MKRIKIVGLCLVAAVALTAVMASVASAASPEYKVCIKAEKVGTEYPTGEFTEKGCGTTGTPTTNKYKLAEWNKGKKVTFKGKGSKGLNTQYSPGKGIIGATECASEKVSGEIVGPKEAKIKVEYKGCKTPEGKNCNSPASSKGKIHDEELETILIGQPGSAEGIGLLVHPVTGSVLAKYECEGPKITAEGGVIGEVTGGATTKAVKTTIDVFRHSNVQEEFQAFAYFGANETESAVKLGEFYEKGTPAPSALILSTVEGAEPPAPPLFTAPATQNNKTENKGEALKIV